MVLPITSHDFGGAIGEVGAIRDTNGTWYPVVDSRGNALDSEFVLVMMASGSDCSDLAVANEWDSPEEGLVEIPEGMPYYAVENPHVSACGEGSFSVVFNLGELLLVSDDNLLGDGNWTLPSS